MGKRSSKRHSWLAQVVCIALMFGLFTSGFAGVASAKETRAAIAINVTGTVMVTKAGGSNEYRAYTDMSLNQGDHIRTESGSSIILQVVDQEDEVTIGPDTELYISSLMETGGAKKSKFKMWAGSVWFKVKKLVNADDEFEVETPTTVMGVRGSNGYIESKLGQLFAMMASGVLATESNGTQGEESSETAVYPGQQINLFEDQSGDLSSGLTGLDISEFVKKADPALIEKLLETIQEIQEENDKFISDVGAGTKQIDPKTGLQLGDASSLSQFKDNLSNLVANVAKSALDENKVDKTTIQKLIDKANEGSGTKIDLNNVKPFDKTIGADPNVLKAKEEALAKMKEQQQQKQDEAKKALEEKQKQNADLLKNLEDKKKELDEANKTAKDEKMKEAQEKYTNTLSAADKAKFEQDKQKADNEKKSQEDQQKTKTGGTTEQSPTNNNTNNPDSNGGDTGTDPGTDTGTAPTVPTFNAANVTTLTQQDSIFLTVNAQPGVIVKAWAGTEERGSSSVGTGGSVSLTIRLVEGNNDIKLSAISSTGLESAKVSLPTIVKDTTPPTALLRVDGNNTIELGTASAAQANLVFDQIAGNPTEMSFANEEGPFGEKITFKATLNNYMLSPGTGAKTVRVKLYDALGNVSNVISTQVNVVNSVNPGLISLSTDSDLSSMHAGDYFFVNVKMDQFNGANSIYAVEIELEYENSIGLSEYTLGDTLFDPSLGDRTSAMSEIGSEPMDDTTSRIVYVGTLFQTDSSQAISNLPVENGRVLVRVPFYTKDRPFPESPWNPEGSIRIKRALIINKDLQPIPTVTGPSLDFYNGGDSF